MKKIVSIFLASIMVLSMLTAFIVPTVAVSDEGGWDVMLSATTDLDDIKRQPIPGYYYDETGFHTDPPNYENYNPKFSVVSKETYDIRNFSMTIVVHDYSAKGDNWLSLSVWSESNGFAQGYVGADKGDGWTSLIRAGADGNVNRLESWDQTIGSRSGKQTFINIDGTQMNPIVFEPIVDAKTGDFTITFEIKNGVVYVNGSVIGENTDACIADRFKDGFAYVGVTLHNTNASGAYSPSVSIIDVNGMTPEGSDYRYPEDRCVYPAPFIPSESVPENQPAIWFDGTFATTYNKLVTSMNCDIEIADDNESIKVTVCASSFFMQFQVPDHISYEAADFPYILMIFKNFCTCYAEEGENLNYACTGAEVGSIWYCAGEVTSPRNDCGAPIDRWYNVTPVDEKYDYVTDDMYTVVVLPINNELWQGRIHSIRMDVASYNNFSDDNRNSFEIMGFGVFRSVEEIKNFIQNFRGIGLDASWFPPYPVTPCDHFDWDEDGLCDNCYEWIGVVEDTTEYNTEEPRTDSIQTEELMTESIKTEDLTEERITESIKTEAITEMTPEEYGTTVFETEAPTTAPERTTDWNPSYDTNFEDGSVAGTARPEETINPDVTTENEESSYECSTYEETTGVHNNTSTPEEVIVPEVTTGYQTDEYETTAPEETTCEEPNSEGSTYEEFPTRECPHLNVNCDDVCDLCGIPMEPHFDWMGDGICDFCGINIFTNEYPEYTSYETPPNSEFEEVTHPEETYVEVVTPNTTFPEVITIPGGPFIDVETLAPDATVENDESSCEEPTSEESTVIEETTIAETSAEETTTKEPLSAESQETVTTNTTDTTSKSSGCGSSASLGAIAIISIIGAAVVIKKKED